LGVVLFLVGRKVESEPWEKKRQEKSHLLWKSEATTNHGGGGSRINSSQKVWRKGEDVGTKGAQTMHAPQDDQKLGTTGLAINSGGGEGGQRQ